MTDTLFLDDMLDADTLASIRQQVTAAVSLDGKLKALTDTMPMLDGAITRAATSCLHIDPLALLADGWATAKAIRAYRDPQANPPGTTSILKLAKHSIERDIKPAITIKLGALQRFPLSLALTVAGVFQGIELAISNGKIVSVGCGTCHLAFHIKLADKAVMAPKTLKEIKLPGEYRFVQPLAIP